MDPIDTDIRAAIGALWAAPPGAAELARARLLLLDTIGCAIAGLREPQVQAYAQAWRAPGPVRLPGLDDGLSTLAFAHVFAAASCWHEACEGLAEAHGRPGLHAIPAVLGPALAERLPLGAMLAAIVAGYEIGGRLGAVCRIRPGMHVDGAWGAFAAAAALARLRGLDPTSAAAAIDHVACGLPCSLYHPITAGSVARNAYVGHGVALGIQAVAATEAGMGGPPGSLAIMAGLLMTAAPERLAHAPGDRLLLRGYLKRWPAVRHVHYGVACAEQWRGDPAAIGRIALHTYAEALTYCGNRAPRSPIQAQFSLSYGVARALAHGTLGPDAYGAEALADPAVARLEHLVEVIVDPAIAHRGARLVVDGWEIAVAQVPDDPGLPMSRDEVVAKFNQFAGPGAERIAAAVLDGSADKALTL
jgi:2-methylcitrate dehydratase PrpD